MTSTPIAKTLPAPSPGASTKLSPRAQSRKDNKERPVFYTLPRAKTPEVALWLNQPSTDGMPLFDGAIDGLQVNLWPRRGEQTGHFLAVFAAEPEKDGTLKQVGTANVVVTLRGMVRFMVRLYGRKEKIWASVLKETPEDALVMSGLKPDRLVQRREAASKLTQQSGIRTENSGDGK